MIEDEFTNLIRERQRRAECEAAGVAYVPDVLAARKVPHCDPEVPAVPDVLLEPNAAPGAPVPDRVLPAPFLVYSPEVIVLCANNGGGKGSAIAPLGEISIELYLDDIPAVTRSELYLVADSQAPLQAALDANLEPLAAGGDPAVFDAAIMAASGLEAAAAAGIRVKALELRGSADGGPSGESTGLYAIAELTAMSRLVCKFNSQRLWVVCDSESPTGFATLLQVPSPLPPAARYRTRPAAFSTSTTSVADANYQAALDAVSDPTFDCVYVSEAMTVTCAVDVDPVFDHTYVEDFDYESTPYGSLQALGATRRWNGSVDSQVTPGFTSYALDSLSSLRRLVTAVNVDAGLYPSASQAEANDRAREAGIRLLNCFFPSRTAVVDCANRSPVNPVADRMDELLLESPSLTADQARDLVFAEMDAEFVNPLFDLIIELRAATPSLTEAQARDQALAELGDGFVTDPAAVTNVGLVPKSPGPGADLDASEGLRVQIPAGMVSSIESAEAAEEEARNHALGFLSCFWVSPAVTCSCVDEDQVSPVPGSYFFTTAQLNALLVNYNTSVSSGALTFAKGDLGSSEDGFIPVSDTMALCQASLVCVYCNQTVPPRCSIAYSSGGEASELWSGTSLGLPLALTSTEGTSSGISAGLPAGIICDSNPSLVNTLAVSTGSLPPLVNEAPGTPRCRYGSREISKTCVEKVGDNAYALTPESAERSISVAAGSFEAETQTEADALAASFINAALICEYGSPPMNVLCGATSAVGTIDPAEYIVVQTYGTGLGVAAEATGGASTPLSAAAHTFTSLESPINAKAQALLSLVTQLDCFWQSAQIDLTCGAPPQLPTASQEQDEQGTITAGDLSKNYADDSHGSTGGEVSLARKSVTSYASQQEANRSAYDLAFSELDCFWQSARIELMCGAPTTCPVGSLPSPETATISSGANAADCCPESIGDVAGDVFTEAKAITSYISQADANTQAYALTYPQLDCFWQSARIELMCGAAPVCPVEQRVTDEEGTVSSGTNAGNCCPNSDGAEPGEVFTAAQAITSYISQADANVQAYAITFPQLDCFWENARVDLRCSAPSKLPPSYNAFQEDQAIQEGGVVQNAPREPFGQSTYSPASNGFDWGDAVTEASTIVSYTSQVDANKQAYAIAYAQLDCFWKSPTMTLSCLPPRSITAAQTLIGEAGVIVYGNEPEAITSDAGMVTSYHNQRDANNQAFGITRAQLRCEGGKDHAFGLSGFATFACCKTKFSQSVVAANLSTFYSPLPSGTGLEQEPYPGFTEVPLNDLADVESCGEEVAYFYLEATCGRQYQEDYSEYYSTSAEVTVYPDERELLVGAPGAYTTVRRLIARVHQDNPNSSVNRAAKDECSGLSIVQLVTCAQKLVSQNHEGNWVPVITDADSPIAPKVQVPPFFLRRIKKDGSDVAQIQIGHLDWTVSKIIFERLTLADGKKVNSLSEAATVAGVEVLDPDNAVDANGWIDLSWFGEVWVKWSVDQVSGEPLALSIAGPGKPEVQAIETLDVELTRKASPGGGEYGYVLKIGSIPSTGDCVQDHSGNITWDITFIPEVAPSSSSEDSDSSDSSISSSSSGSYDSSRSEDGPSGGSTSLGSDKSTAIVPDPKSKHGYVALFTKEAPEVLFEDFIRVAVPVSNYACHQIDPRFLRVCEKDSVRIVSVVTDRPVLVGARIVGGYAVFEVVGSGPTVINAQLVGTRRGFAGMRFPARDVEQFEANERTLNAAYPAKDLDNDDE